MPLNLSSPGRAVVAGAGSAGLLIGAFILGTGQGSTSSAGTQAMPATLASTSGSTAGSRITVTGTGTVTGAPDQLLLSMGVQTSGASVGGALVRANQAVRAVTGALGRTGVRPSDIQTSGLSVYPSYGTGSLVPTSYNVSESIQGTLGPLASAGTQMSDAVRAGGNATVIDGVSLNLSDTSSLLAGARGKAVADAKIKATQYARALGQPLGPVVSVSESTSPPP